MAGHHAGGPGAAEGPHGEPVDAETVQVPPDRLNRAQLGGEKRRGSAQHIIHVGALGLERGLIGLTDDGREGGGQDEAGDGQGDDQLQQSEARGRPAAHRGGFIGPSAGLRGTRT